jgi:glucosylceramidase
LSQGAQQNLLKAYFGSEGSGLVFTFLLQETLGIGYTIGRTPIGSCDFSTHVYSYDDVSGDFALENFSLTNEDYQYKV